MVAALLTLLTACAPGQTGQGDTGPSRPDVISQEEIASLGVSTAAEVIERLHPEWLRGRGLTSAGRSDTPIVYIDDSRAGGLHTLRQIPTETVREIRFIPGTDAGVRYGLGHGGGVISVLTVR